jgi:hypothetical protein
MWPAMTLGLASSFRGLVDSTLVDVLMLAAVTAKHCNNSLTKSYIKDKIPQGCGTAEKITVSF